MKGTLAENFGVIVASPTSIAALLGIIALIVAFIRFRKIEINTRMIVSIGVALALTIVLHAIRIYHMPQGGSVTLGSMVPLMIIAFRYGPAVGALAGFTYGMLNLIQDPFILHPVQVLFDYPLPFMAMGLAGFFPQQKMLGAAAAILGRFLCHYTAGVVFFASYAPPGMSPYLYSLVFNGSYLVPELVICLLIIGFLPFRRIETAM